jgi:peptidoglycan/LPS O-acetylase OafA/YrhL
VKSDVLWAIAFLANVHFAHVGVDYFTQSVATTSPIQHYWSLAVEEQFYLVWPVVLLAVAACARRARINPRFCVVTTALGGTALSLLWSIHHIHANRTAAYFGTADRAWELGVGVCIALIGPALWARLPELLRAAMTYLGVAGILFSCIHFSSSTPFPGRAALLPVLSAAAVIVGGIGSPRGGANHLLGRQPLRYLGDISYSLYLWHFPALILVGDAMGVRFTAPWRVVVVGFVIVISAASYHLIENPIRRASWTMRRPSRGFLWWPVTVGVVVVVALVVTPTLTYTSRTGPASSLAPVAAVADAVVAGQSADPVPHATTPSLLTASRDWVRLGTCSAYQALTSRICQMGDARSRHTIVLFGNSHSVMWTPALKVVAARDHWRFFPVVKEACGYDWYVNYQHQLPSNNQCSLWYHWALTQLARLHPDVIVMGTYANTTWWTQGQARVLTDLHRYAPRVVLLSDTPWIGSPADCLLTRGATQGSCLKPLRPLVIRLNHESADVARASHSQFLNVLGWFCRAGRCPSLINGIVPFYDGAHLTPEYSTYLGAALEHALNLSGVTVRPVASSGGA